MPAPVSLYRGLCDWAGGGTRLLSPRTAHLLTVAQLVGVLVAAGLVLLEVLADNVHLGLGVIPLELLEILELLRPGGGQHQQGREYHLRAQTDGIQLYRNKDTPTGEHR